MTKKNSSIDGFVPRRPGSQVGERHVVNASSSAPKRKELRSEDDLQKSAIGTPRAGRLMGRSDIDDSLNQIDDPTEKHHERKLSRKERKRLKKELRTRDRRFVSELSLSPSL